LNHLFEDGVNVSLGLAWSGELAGRKSGGGISAIYSTAEGTDWSTFSLPPGSQTTTKKGSYSVAVELSHLIVESARTPGKGLGLYAKAAIADGNPNPFKRSLVGGIAGHAIVPGRPLDYFGVGYFFYDLSDQLQDAVAPVGSLKDEQGIEAYYTFVPTPWLLLTANLQWVNPANGANPSVWLGGVRARVAF
jgi:porin